MSTVRACEERTGPGRPVRSSYDEHNMEWRGVANRENRWIGGVLAVALCAVVMGCDEKKPSDSTNDLADDQVEETEEERQKRLRGEAFGLPLPPRVLEIVRQGNHIFVKTDLKIKKLEEFYKKNLVDYEVIVVGSSMRAIPLREKMPWIRVSRPFGPRHPLHVTYIAADAVAPAPIVTRGPGALSEEEVVEELKKRQKPLPEPHVPRRGQPVELRTPSGELLAPGARWGEPYTPPPGSPLDKPRNRYNFGVPFGEWSAD